ncbi:hypothetical protein GF345_05600 [Candidatus Woesearchaeota archaeon]|nr:hypothetical protein [Candidatus Woesearchaeota archaeon]
MKKGDLSLNLIIIAAILMIIFVVLIVIFSGRMSIFRGSVEKCEPVHGTCVKTGCDGQYEVIDRQYSCDMDGDQNFDEEQQVDGLCCVSVG